MNGRPWPTTTHVRHWFSPSLPCEGVRAGARTWTHVQAIHVHLDDDVTLPRRGWSIYRLSSTNYRLVDDHKNQWGSEQERGWWPCVSGLWSLVAFHPRGLALSLCVWGTLVAAPTTNHPCQQREWEMFLSCRTAGSAWRNSRLPEILVSAFFSFAERIAWRRSVSDGLVRLFEPVYRSAN